MAGEELLKAYGQSGGTNLPPVRDDGNYAVYGLVCT